MVELTDPQMPKVLSEVGTTVIGITDEFCLKHLDASH